MSGIKLQLSKLEKASTSQVARSTSQMGLHKSPTEKKSPLMKGGMQVFKLKNGKVSESEDYSASAMDAKKSIKSHGKDFVDQILCSNILTKKSIEVPQESDLT